jgi:hypothetical protein
MPLDKELYRQAYEHYRQWNEAELIARAREAGKLSPQELWQRYLALIDFGLSTSPQPSPWQREQKLEYFARYYENIQRLEKWRRCDERAT